MLNKLKSFFKRINPQKEELVVPAAELIPFKKRMKHLENYFKKHAESNHLFRPGYEAAKKINVIALKNEISVSELKEIIQIFNEVNQQPHHSGSGWFNLRLHIHSIIDSNNIEFIPTSKGDIKLVNQIEN